MDARENILASPAFVKPELQYAESFPSYLPPYIDDPSECRVCPFFGHACNPPLSYQGASIITEDEVLAKIEAHEALDEPRNEYKALHDELAEYLKQMTPKEFKGGSKKQIIAGKYLIESTWQKNTKMDLPKEVEASLKQYVKVDDAGKFTFKIVKVSE